MARTTPPKALPIRRSIRHTEHDYTATAWYHVTICAERRGRTFGRLGVGKVLLSDLGRIVEEKLLALPARIPVTRLDTHIVMPDHVHALVQIHPALPNTLRSSLVCRRFGGSHAGALSLVVNLFKGDVTRLARRTLGMPELKIWQRGYHERIIRNQAQMDATRAYIRNNPIRG